MSKILYFLRVFKRDFPILLTALRTRWQLWQLSQKYSKPPLIVALIEHLGDLIAAEPIARHLQQTAPDRPIFWLVRSTFAPVLNQHPCVAETVVITCLRELHFLKKLKISLIDLHVSGKSCHKTQLLYWNNPNVTVENYYHLGNLLEVFSRAGNLENVLKTQPLLYPETVDTSRFSFLSKPYIVLHTLSNDPHRDWNLDGWSQLVDSLISNRCCVLEIGSKSLLHHIQNPLFINLSAQTSISETIFLIQNCSLFIGIDSAPAHIAHAANVPMIVLLGKLYHFENYLPYSDFTPTTMPILKQIISKDAPNDTVLEHLKAFSDNIIKRKI